MQVSDHPRGQVIAAEGTTDLPLLLQTTQHAQSRAVAHLADRAGGPEDVIELAACAKLIARAFADAVIPPPGQLVETGRYADESYFVTAKGLVLTR